jgi:hypothetical protein
MLALADYANDDGESWPSVASLTRKSRLSERGVQTVLKRLAVAGWLEIEPGNGRNNTNLYRIINPAPAAPRTGCTPQMKAETPQMTALNPAPAAPKPLEPSIEPSEEPPVVPQVKKTRRAVALPDGWVPSQKNIQDAKSHNFSDEDIKNEADQFRDYHHAKGTTFKDWDAGWRTWLRNSRKFGGRSVAVKANSGGYGQGGSIASVVARREAQRRNGG